MKRTWKTVILIAIGVVMVSCRQPETGPDPAAVDVQHYKIEFENDRVRVVRISYGPGEESVMHYHPDSVAVFLTDQDVTFGMADGTSEESHVAAGKHHFAAAGQHLPKNIGDAPLELVLVELKSGGAQTDAGAAGETGPDPTEVDADHYTAEFENERVRVVRISYGRCRRPQSSGLPSRSRRTRSSWLMDIPPATRRQVPRIAGSPIGSPKPASFSAFRCSIMW